MRARGPLAIGSFRSVWLSGLVSDAGDWLLFIALPLVVLERSGSAFGTSVAFLLEVVPGIAMTPVAAWCAERLQPRRFLASIAVAQGVALLPLLFVASSTPAVALTLVFTVIVVESVLTAVSDPARNALLPRLVPADELVAANSLIGLAQNAARLVGGPLGGVLYAVGGLNTVALCDLVSYVVAAGLIARVAVPSAPSGLDEVERPGVTTRAVLRLPVARRLLGITFGCQIAQGMFVVLFVLFIVRSLNGNSTDVGLLRGVQAVGAIAGALVLTAVARRVTPAALVAWATIGFGVLSLLIWNGPSVTTAVWPYAVAFAVAGAPGVVLGTGLVSGLQTGVPALAHGRAFALSNLASYAGQGVGILAAGLLTAVVGLTAMLDLQAGVYLTVGVVAIRGAERGLRAQAGLRPVRRAAQR